MTDDEAVLAMTDDNLRHRKKILPMEKAQSLKIQVDMVGTRFCFYDLYPFLLA